MVVKMCKQCQMVRSMGSVRSEDEEMKNILVCELFYRVALDTTGPLLETKSGNKYILVVVDHYSKWCKSKAVVDHGAKTSAKFLEDDVICRYGVPINPKPEILGSVPNMVAKKRASTTHLLLTQPYSLCKVSNSSAVTHTSLQWSGFGILHLLILHYRTVLTELHTLLTYLTLLHS